MRIGLHAFKKASEFKKQRRIAKSTTRASDVTELKFEFHNFVLNTEVVTVPRFREKRRQ